MPVLENTSYISIYIHFTIGHRWQINGSISKKWPDLPQSLARRTFSLNNQTLMTSLLDYIQYLRTISSRFYYWSLQKFHSSSNCIKILHCRFIVSNNWISIHIYTYWFERLGDCWLNFGDECWPCLGDECWPGFGDDCWSRSVDPEFALSNLGENWWLLCCSGKWIDCWPYLPIYQNVPAKF